MWLYPEVRTLGDLPGYYARREPGRPVLRTGDRLINSLGFEQTANRVGHFLMASGAAPGRLIGFLGKNSFDFYFAMFGCVTTSATFAVLNWRLTPPELAVLIDDSDAQLVLIEREMEQLWKDACALVRKAPDTVWFDATDTLEAQVASFPAGRPDVAVDEEGTAIQLYTSGTTGRPKGVMLSHGGFNRMRLCEHLEPAYDWRDGDGFLNPLPNFHLLHVGIALQCLYNGVAINVVRQFDPSAVLSSIEGLRPSLLTLTPTMLQMLLDHPQAAAIDFSSLRLVLYAGSPIALGLIKRALAAMPARFMQFYGSTEIGGAASLLRPEEHDLTDERRLQSCGRPLPLIEFKIVDGNDVEVPTGEPGELLIRTPSITKGYWRQPDATAAVLKHGWYRSGDIARRDAEGLYYIVDRAKDMIVTGGENVYSAEVENAMSTHPAVAAVAVIGIPDLRWGEAVKAIVILRANSSVGEAELIAHCRSMLANYKVPKSIDFVASFPLVSSGKISKKDLRARYWGAQTRAVG